MPTVLFLSISLSHPLRHLVILCATPVEDYNNAYYYCTPALRRLVLRSRKDRLRTQRYSGTVKKWVYLKCCRLYRVEYRYP